MRKCVLATTLSLVCIFLLSSCSSETRSTPSTETSVTTELEPPVTSKPLPPPEPTTSVLFEFASPRSVTGWASVDDSVMGGISASTTTWVETNGSGALLFSGMMTTEQNGGFTSTFGPADQRLGQAAAGSTALGVNAIGDGRTYVMQLRTSQSGPMDCPIHTDKHFYREQRSSRRASHQLVCTGEPLPQPCDSERPTRSSDHRSDRHLSHR